MDIFGNTSIGSVPQQGLDPGSIPEFGGVEIIANTNPSLTIQDSDSTGASATNNIFFTDQNSTIVGKLQHLNGDIILENNNTSENLVLKSNTTQLTVDNTNSKITTNAKVDVSSNQINNISALDLNVEVSDPVPEVGDVTLYVKDDLGTKRLYLNDGTGIQTIASGSLPNQDVNTDSSPVFAGLTVQADTDTSISIQDTQGTAGNTNTTVYFLNESTSPGNNIEGFLKKDSNTFNLVNTTDNGQIGLYCSGSTIILDDNIQTTTVNHNLTVEQELKANTLTVENISPTLTLKDSDSGSGATTSTIAFANNVGINQAFIEVLNNSFRLANLNIGGVLSMLNGTTEVVLDDSTQTIRLTGTVDADQNDIINVSAINPSYSISDVGLSGYDKIAVKGWIQKNSSYYKDTTTLVKNYQNSWSTFEINSYIGGVYHPLLDRVFFAPYGQNTSNYYHSVDTKDDSIIQTEHGLTPGLAGGYYGGSYDSINHEVIFCPHNATTSWLKVDTFGVYSLYTIAPAPSPVSPTSYAGSVFMNNYIYFVPFGDSNQANWHRYNCLSQSVQTYAHGVVGLPQYAFLGGCYDPVGQRMFLVPYANSSSSTWYYITPLGTVTSYANAQAIPANEFTGGAYDPYNHYIWLVSQTTNGTWYYIDLNTPNPTVNSYTTGQTILGSYNHAQYCPKSNRIYLIPYSQSNATTWHYIDCYTKTMISYDTSAYLTLFQFRYRGSTYAKGKVYLSPNNNGNANFHLTIDSGAGGDAPESFISSAIMNSL